MRISDWSSDVCSSDLVAVIDARGLRCPWPALRLARAVRQAGGGCFELLAEDPAAAHDIPRLAEEHGWQIEPLPADPPLPHWRIRSEERRAGPESASPCRSRWPADHSKKKQNNTQ